ncbi:GFA family protein [Tateyamaria sp. SN3-11]|uniref:GFA family protein n=1 Tax=Tateyamaria sp. SN3-11 TaxID=3092147 RepID=UPI0039E9F98B
MSFSSAPHTVAYCHCRDCRRWTGAPVAAFVAFDRAALPDLGAPQVHGPGVERWNCPGCGSPLAAWFPYLPDQVYVPIGVMDQADVLPPALHSHADSALPWLHIDDTAPRESGSARDALSESAP